MILHEIHIFLALLTLQHCLTTFKYFFSLCQQNRWLLVCCVWFPSNMDFIPKSSPSVSSDHISFYHMARASSVCSSVYLKWMQHNRGGLLVAPLPYRPTLCGAREIVLTCTDAPVSVRKTWTSSKFSPGLTAASLFSSARSSTLEGRPDTGLPWVGPSASTS